MTDMTKPVRIQLSRRKGFKQKLDRWRGMVDCDLKFLERAIERGDPRDHLTLRVKDLRWLLDKCPTIPRGLT